MNGTSVSGKKLRLIYLEERGKTDLIKMILSVGGQCYEDIQIKPTEWTAFSPYMPFEQLPVLLVNDEFKLAQPTVICRYLARLLRLSGSNEEESIACDMIVEQLRELIDFSIQILQERNDPVRRQMLYAEFASSLLPRTLNGYERILSLSRSKFIVGNQLSWADLALVNGWEWLDELCRPVLNKYQMVRAHNEYIRSLAPVAAWLKATKPLSLTKNV
jgi:glutathione S-transferase